MRKYKGFTVYELIIVISIIALMATFTTISLGTAYRNNVSRAGEKIESSVKQARNNAISKGSNNGFANFYWKNNSLYCKIGEEVTAGETINTDDWDLILNGIEMVHVRFSLSDGSSSGLTFSSGTPLIVIGFKQSTGEGYMKFPYGGDTKYTGDMSIGIETKSKECEVNIDRFGSIVVD